MVSVRPGLVVDVLGKLLTAQEARVALRYHLVWLLASFVVSNLLRASITRRMYANHEAIDNCKIWLFYICIAFKIRNFTTY